MPLFRRSASKDSSATSNSTTSKSKMPWKDRRGSSPKDSAVDATEEDEEELPLQHVSLPRAPDPSVDPVIYMKSVYAVRERCRYVLDHAKKNQLKHFKVDMSKFQDVVDYVCAIIKRDYGPDYADIPPHGRWQHFNVGGVDRIQELLHSWEGVDSNERTRRLLDLFLVSVLLDAGAGNRWSYKAEDGQTYRRSEGLAIASLDMFKQGLFSGDPSQPCRVDSRGLSRLNLEVMAKGLQSTEDAPLDGIQGRTELLVRLGEALFNQSFFGPDARPGNMLDFLLSHSSSHDTTPPIILVPTLWSVLIEGLGPIWPDSRTQINGKSVGDAWPCAVMPSHPSNHWESIVPFHKLTQWLTYSLMVPMQRILGIQFAGTELLTGLAEYRNGGLLIDTGLLTLNSADAKRGLAQFEQQHMQGVQKHAEIVPLFTPDDDVVVEWRAVTVGMLDELLPEVNSMLGLTGRKKLSLAQMLEAGSWKGGREIAEMSRPITRGPPIMILSDGTVF